MQFEKRRIAFIAKGFGHRKYIMPLHTVRYIILLHQLLLISEKTQKFNKWRWAAVLLQTRDFIWIFLYALWGWPAWLLKRSESKLLSRLKGYSLCSGFGFLLAVCLLRLRDCSLIISWWPGTHSWTLLCSSSTDIGSSGPIFLGAPQGWRCLTRNRNVGKKSSPNPFASVTQKQGSTLRRCLLLVQCSGFQ